MDEYLWDAFYGPHLEVSHMILITFHWLQVNHKPTQIQEEGYIPYLLMRRVSRSCCREACGRADIAGAIFGKYNLLHRASY